MTTNVVEVRALRLGDEVPALVALGRELFSETFGHLYPVAHLEQYLASSYTVEHVARWVGGEGQMELLGAFSGRNIVGYCLTGPCTLPLDEATASHGEIHKLYVKREQFGSGTSSKLMKIAMSSLKERFPRHDHVYLGVYSENPRAIAFYSKFGFAKVGEYEFIVGETRDREFIMRASLDACL